MPFKTPVYTKLNLLVRRPTRRSKSSAFASTSPGRSAPFFGSSRYIGMVVQKETTAIAVLDASRKLAMESIIETKAIAIAEFFRGLRGDLRENPNRRAGLCNGPSP